MADLTEQWAVVTGAAGGMGRAIATALAAQGRPPIPRDLDADRLADVATALVTDRPVEIVAGDVIELLTVP